LFELNKRNKEKLVQLLIPENRVLLEQFLLKQYKINYSHPHGHEEVSNVHVNIVADCVMEFLSFLKKPLPAHSVEELLKICLDYELFFNSKTKTKQINTKNEMKEVQTTKSLSKETLKKYAGSIKTFLRYCADNELIDEAVVNKIRRQKIFKVSYSDKPRYNYLTDIDEKERDAIVFSQAKDPLVFAWLSLLRETGARLGELRNLKIGMVLRKEGQQYAEVVLDGKTGRRIVPILNSMEPLFRWIDRHPDKNNPNAYVFLSYAYSLDKKKRVYDSSKALTHAYFLGKVKKVAKELGIKREVRCHLFRHLKAVEKNVNEPTANELMGWSKNSKMYGHYGSGNKEATLDAVYALSGIKRQENKELEGQFKVCQNCHEINSAEKAYCQRCSLELSFTKPSSEIPEIKAMLERLEKLEQLQQYNLTEVNKKISRMSVEQYSSLINRLENASCQRI